MEQVIFGDAPLQWQQVVAVARDGQPLALSDSAWQRMANSRAVVEQIVAQGERAYGINTGLGALCNVVLSPQALTTLSRNTLLSHACGVGPLLSVAQTRAIICAAIANFSHGYSGIAPATVEKLMALLNGGITPCVPSQGSVGYLTHMAHVGLALLGVGEVQCGEQRLPAAEALAQQGIALLVPGAKEGLSLVNGTPCMTGLSCLALAETENLFDWADITGAMSFEALGGQTVAFDPAVLALKAGKGQQVVGERLRTLLQGSEIIAKHQGVRTQDALSLRSMPQIHGACRDQLAFAATQINIELNAATDNPLILGQPDAWRVVSQANPHGEAVAMAADNLAIALAEIGSVAERRLDRLVNPLVSGLPAFLVTQPGVNSGMMIAQYVAASLCAENKQLAQPSVLDNYVTSALQEDHLSLGTLSALKLHKLTDNVRHILAIEYLLAGQALEFHQGLQLGAGTGQALGRLRERIATWHEDRWLAPEIATSADILRQPASRVNAHQGVLNQSGALH
ncbi:histidine ammonia-lyase [Enterobacterales bacterium CwR94]|nr:histidine ammonia-lyase [Enterobacterales bacterium CwR94]